MAEQRNTVTFTEAAIKLLTSKRLISGDKEYELRIRTSDPGIIACEVFDAATTFKVTLEAE